MDFQDAWSQALKKTEIVRTRVSSLQTFSDTRVPYILLSESSINDGDTVVRKGEVTVEKPALILPPNLPEFEGFELENGQANDMINFLIVRGINLPSLRYNNQTYSLDVYEGKLSEAVKFYNNQFQREENVSAGLLLGPEDLWPFSLLIFICSQIARNSSTDIKRLLDDYKRKNRDSKS